MLWFQIFLQTIVFLLIIDTSTAQLFDQCIEPDPICPNVNVTFFLYTRANQDNPHQLLVNTPDSITSAPFVKDAPIKIIIHGYTKNKDSTPNTILRPAYYECCDYNLISVDYGPLALSPCYIQAAHNAPLVANCTAQLVDALVQIADISLTQFHVIGFSLGGQIAGLIANFLKSGRFERITGLDPALPLFVTLDDDQKLDSSDAKFVDVLHTDALQNGKLEPSGTVDFYANGGAYQPGCVESNITDVPSCSHNRAPMYYGESINSNIGFYAKKFLNYLSLVLGIPISNEEILYGEYVSLSASGLYFFSTNSVPPYAQGPSN